MTPVAETNAETNAELLLVARVRTGHQASCSRLMSWAERGDARFARAYNAFYSDLGGARRIGVTGPPGAGKSTLVEGLTRHWRGQDKTVGIVAVDPTSPFSGGALLGDRVRMTSLALDEGVFIGSDAQLVAPVRVRKGAYVAAGTTVTEDVPAGALAIGRARQTNVKGWVARRKR